MKRNGRNGHPPTESPFLAAFPFALAGVTVPGMEFEASEYSVLKQAFFLYEDAILMRKFSDAGDATPFSAVDPLDFANALVGVKPTTPLLPPGCLFWQRADGGERLAIYAGPQVWAVHVADPSTSSGGAAGEKRQALRVPMPGLVWIGHGTAYSLYAVKGDSWPTADSELFNPPTPNVSGGICHGNVPFPVASAETIWPALRLFFESDFNDHLSNDKSKAFPKSVLGQWRALTKAKAESWPEGDLVGAGKRLREVMG